MLAHLRIVDFAIIEEVELAPGPGFNVLTGETGAGKSIIVGAVGLLRGGRASAELVRSGREEAVVEAVFDLAHDPRAAARLEAAGLPAVGDELLVRRVIARNGRGRAYLNGGLCTVAVLADVVGQLLDISGQHEHQLLSDRATHRRLLDALGVPAAVLTAVAQAHERLRRAAEGLARSQLDDRQRAARLDFLRFQLAELERAALQPGEDEGLTAERARLLRATELAGAAAGGEATLYSAEGAVVDQLGRVQRQLAALAPVDPRLPPLARQLEEARVIVEDVALSLRRYAADAELDPARLGVVEERLEVIHHLQRKHGSSVEEILARQAEMRRELDELSSLEERRDALAAELDAARRAAATVGAELSARRGEAARSLGTAVTKELGALRMAGARLAALVTPRPPREGDDPALLFDGRRLGADGWDRVELHIATNPGEEPRPLQHVTSGGELSRVMLALRKVLGHHDPVPTSIYDEVDAGIGGAVADVVGRALAAVARHRQVLCVTHLPQVAAHAETHFHVGKVRVGRRVRTSVEALSPERRTEELARMLGGERVTTEARANARQLLDAARRG